jgi:hypothetical protein
VSRYPLPIAICPGSGNQGPGRFLKQRLPVVLGIVGRPDPEERADRCGRGLEKPEPRHPANPRHPSTLHVGGYCMGNLFLVVLVHQ